MQSRQGGGEERVWCRSSGRFETEIARRICGRRRSGSYSFRYSPEPESVTDEAPTAFGDLFGTPPSARPKKAKAAKPIKRVFAITLTEPGPFAFAGIWDSWKRPDGTRLETFALVTTEPNELVAQIHDRLALILHPRDYDRWLGIDDCGGDPRPPFDLLHPMDSTLMKMTPANPAVGNRRYNGPEMLNE